MNVDDEEDPYSYNQSDNQEPTMNFQTKKLLSNFEELIKMTEGITRSKYVNNNSMQNKTAILDFLDLIISIMKNKRFTAGVELNKNNCQLCLLVFIILS